MSQLGTYHLIVEGLPVLIRYEQDLDHPDPRRGMCVTVAYVYEATEARGLPNAEESAFVDSLERGIVQAARPDLLLLWVGRRSGHGRADLCFYAKDHERLEIDLRAILGRWPERDLVLRLIEDREWEIYAQAFLPGEDQILSADNLAGIEEQIIRGVDICGSFAVRHRVLFRDDPSAEAFAIAAAAEGQKVSRSKEEGLHEVSIHLTHDLLLATVEIQTRRVQRKAKAAGGRYDGWSLASETL